MPLTSDLQLGAMCRSQDEPVKHYEWFLRSIDHTRHDATFRDFTHARDVTLDLPNSVTYLLFRFDWAWCAYRRTGQKNPWHWDVEDQYFHTSVCYACMLILSIAASIASNNRKYKYIQVSSDSLPRCWCEWLTHLPLLPHICVSELCQHWFR